MATKSRDFEGLKDFNVLQIVALSIATTVIVFLGVLSAGAIWWVALCTSWIFSPAATLLVAATVFNSNDKRRSRQFSVATGPALVPMNISDPMQLWEADRLMEIEHASHQQDELERFAQDPKIRQPSFEERQIVATPQEEWLNTHLRAVKGRQAG